MCLTFTFKHGTPLPPLPPYVIGASGPDSHHSILLANRPTQSFLSDIEAESEFFVFFFGNFKSRIELLSSGGLRHDNRRPYELRQLDFSILTSPPSGSDAAAAVSHGLTRVIAYVTGPRESAGGVRGLGGGINSSANGTINVQISTAPFSGPERKRVGKSDKKMSDLAYSIQNTFEPVVMLNLYPRSVIEIYIEVLQQDGGQSFA